MLQVEPVVGEVFASRVENEKKVVDVRRRERTTKVFVSINVIFLKDRISGFYLTQSDILTKLTKF